ncbi:MAG TPA: aconitate hydratase [Acidimicrobiales bacterium]|nr:aconitate hydratase [Acidimicrobiales bacterium]
MSEDSFHGRGDLRVGERSYEIFRIAAAGDVARLPFSLKILLENLLRNEDGVTVTADDVRALAGWDPNAEPSREISFAPARILLQDFTGVPAVVDLAAMRDAMEALGGDPSRVNPLIPAELVIDHSVVVDRAGTADAFKTNAELEFQRNRERYQFLRWGQTSFSGLEVVPPDTGICHQVNLEYLSRVVFVDGDGDGRAYPDTLVGTDSHTPMVNGLGVLGWGVGGIEAEAAMLGQPISMLIPRVVGFKLSGQLRPGTTATDLVLTIAEMLRKHGVVGKLVEFYGPGVASVALENRATIGNMSPEYGSTATIFPIDAETLRYMSFTGRSDEQVALVEAYAKEQGLWHDPDHEPMFSERLELDLGTVEPSLAGPARPQDRVPLDRAREMFPAALRAVMPSAVEEGNGSTPMPDQSVDKGSADSFPASDPASFQQPGGRAVSVEPARKPGGTIKRSPTSVTLEGGSKVELDHGSIVIAAITSCTNTSNPSVMLAAGLLARKAVEAGLASKPWVKTSLAPGSRVVTEYYDRAGLTPYLEKLGFNLVGYGCTTCIGNSGPLDPAISAAADNLALVSVLSGNRNFEGRINPDVRMNYLASPPLVVAYALAGTMDFDLTSDPLGHRSDGTPVTLADIWPTQDEVAASVREAVRSEMFADAYGSVFEGDERWRSLEVPSGDRYVWSDTSTYVRKPPFFEGITPEPAPVGDITGARCLAKLGDSVTTDHISPAGSIRATSPAGRWLIENGVDPSDFNSYGARRGNHEVMIRGTFANIRLRNQLAPGTEGGVTRHQPTGEEMSIFEASERYGRDGVPLVILAGKEYGSGSSRDWAAKGPALLGVRAVIAESFERIHRSNLIGMGILPLQFPDGENADSLGLSGTEEFSVTGLADSGTGPLPTTVTVNAGGVEFAARVRIDTPAEADYYRHGGILQYVLRQLARR